MRFPTLISLQALMQYFESDATTFLADLGLSKDDYERIRSTPFLYQDIADRLLVPADTTYDINAWVGQDVVIPKQSGRPHSVLDPDDLNSYLSQQFASVRHAGITYP